MVDHIQALHRIKYPPEKQQQSTPPMPEPEYFNDKNQVVEAMQALDRWGVLPFAGGWFDQPDDWNHDLKEVLRTYDAIPERLDATGWFTVSGDVRKPKSEDEKILDGLRDRYGH